MICLMGIDKKIRFVRHEPRRRQHCNRLALYPTLTYKLYSMAIPAYFKTKALQFGFLFSIVITSSCNSDERTVNLLKSHSKDDKILGANRAGESGKKKFIPLLLENADDPRTSTNFRFKGVSVYQAKMNALKKILKLDPPGWITADPDSQIIVFYSQFINN